MAACFLPLAAADAAPRLLSLHQGLAGRGPARSGRVVSGRPSPVFVVMASIGDVRAAYLALGVAVCVGAYLSRVIAKQYAFFMTANDRLRVRTVRRWQRLWSAIPTRPGPAACLPEISDYSGASRSSPSPTPSASGPCSWPSRRRSPGTPEPSASRRSSWPCRSLWVAPGRPRGRPGRAVLAVASGVVAGPRHLVLLQPPPDPGRGGLPLPDAADEEPRRPGPRGLRLARPLRHRHPLGRDRLARAAELARGPRSATGDADARGPEDPRRGRAVPDGKLTSPHEKIFMEQLPPEEQDAYRERLREQAARRRRSEPEPQRAGARRIRPRSLGSSGPRSPLCSAVLLGPPLAFFLVFWFVSGRLLTAYYDALEAPGAYAQSTTKPVG